MAEQQYETSTLIRTTFDSRELLARIRAITRSITPSADNVLRFGNVSLHRATFELKSPTDSVKLAAKEYQMMEYLMVNQGILISTEQFMDKVWGIDFEGDINIVWTNLSYLRKKLYKIGANVWCISFHCLLTHI